MRDYRPARSLLRLVFPLFLLPGCQVFQAEHSIAILQCATPRRKNRSRPSRYTSVSVFKGDEFPCHLLGLTQADGIARLRIEPTSEHGIQLHARPRLPVREAERGRRRPQEDRSGLLDSHDRAGSCGFCRRSVFRPPGFAVEVLGGSAELSGADPGPRSGSRRIRPSYRANAVSAIRCRRRGRWRQQAPRVVTAWRLRIIGRAMPTANPCPRRWTSAKLVSLAQSRGQSSVVRGGHADRI